MPALRVLLVDDDAILRELLVEALGRFGLDVGAAANADEAARALHAAAFDVLVLDDRMPGLTGRQLLAELRARGDATPAIFYSGSLVLTEEERVRLGVHCVMPKPARTHELAEAIFDAARAAAG